MADDLDELASMAVFARVVEARSFSEAARRLGLSKSAVSKRIARLEDRLGTALLVRTTRKLALTETGAAFYERCARIVSEAVEARSEVSEAGTTPRGGLRVNAPVTLTQMYVGWLIPQFLERHPEVQIELTLDDRFVNVIEEGFDVSIRVAALEDSSLVARKLATDRRVVCASPDYLAEAGTPRHPRDLLNHNCLHYTYLPVRDEWQFVGPEGRFSVPVRGNLQANDGSVLRDAAVGGLGVVMAPRFMVREALTLGHLQPLLEDWRLPDHGIYAMYAQRRHVSPKVRAFVRFLAETFRDF